MDRVENIIEMARLAAGTGVVVRTSEVVDLLAAGWDGIPINAIVWADSLRMDCATKLQRKISATEIRMEGRAANGEWRTKTITPNADTKDRILDAYIARHIIGRKEVSNA